MSLLQSAPYNYSNYYCDTKMHPAGERSQRHYLLSYDSLIYLKAGGFKITSIRLVKHQPSIKFLYELLNTHPRCHTT